MKKLYDICGLCVECDFRFATMISRAEKYLCAAPAAKTPDIIIPFSPQEISRLKSIEPSLDDDNCEIIYSAEMFYVELLRFGGFMLHSSAVAVDGGGYLFSAPSGTGKSTHTALWRELLGDRAVILNDDKPAIMIGEQQVTVCGTPWSGKSDLNANMRVPLRGICVLGRSAENFIEPLPAANAVYSLLNQTIRPKDPEKMSLLMDYVTKTAEAVKLWRMGCNISLDAARLAYEAMSR